MLQRMRLSFNWWMRFKHAFVFYLKENFHVFMIFEIFLYFYYWHFISSWQKTGTLHLKRNTDVHDSDISDSCNGPN
jgi:hypothetical protein